MIAFAAAARSAVDQYCARIDERAAGEAAERRPAREASGACAAGVLCVAVAVMMALPI